MIIAALYRRALDLVRQEISSAGLDFSFESGDSVLQILDMPLMEETLVMQRIVGTWSSQLSAGVIIFLGRA